MQSPALDYSQKAVTGPSIRYSKLVPQSGLVNFTLSTSSTTECIIELPQKALYMDQSFISFQVSIAESGTASEVIDTHMMSTMAIDHISLATRSGQYLSDISNLDKYMRIVQPRCTEFEEFKTNDAFLPAATSALAVTTGNWLARSNALASATTVAATPTGAEITAGGASFQAPSLSYDGIKVVSVGAVRDGAGAGNVVFNVQMRLGQIPYSIFADKRCLYFNEVIVLRILFAPVNRLGFRAALNVLPGTALDTAVTLNNVALYSAIETNPVIIDEIVNRVNNGGMKLTIPWVNTFKTSSAVTTYLPIQQKLNRSHGKSLLKVFNGLFHATESGSTCYDNSNVASAKIVDLYSVMDNSRIQDGLLTCASNDDYRENRKLYDKCVIQNSQMFKQHMAYCDSWDGYTFIDSARNATVDNGLSLLQERLYQINYDTVSAAYAHYSFFITQKDLIIGGGQVMCV